MRGTIERFFCNPQTGLLRRMPGQTFGSIREKGDADPGARAALTFDDLAFCLVRWIVDVYHITPHDGLGGETPLHCWRRLTAEWGVQPPPDRDTHRAVFGERLARKLSREGVSVLGMRYHSEQLAQWMLHKEGRDVEVRWDPENIGSVTVYAGNQKFDVGAVLPGFDGVSARKWIAAIREVRASNQRRQSCERRVILAAIDAIEARSTEATQLAGLLVDEWSPERIRQQEDRLFIGFGVVEDRPVQPVAGDRIGRSIATPVSQGPASDERAARPAPAHPAIASPTETTVTDTAGPAPAAGSWKITE